MNALLPFERQYPAVGPLIVAIAAWYRKWRSESERSDLDTWAHEDVERIARDIGLTAGDLRVLNRTKEPPLLPRMLAALRIDAADLARTEPAVLRDLQRVCAMCDSQRRCRSELDDGDAASTYEGFCPNAVTLKGMT